MFANRFVVPAAMLLHNRSYPSQAPRLSILPPTLKHRFEKTHQPFAIHEVRNAERTHQSLARSVPTQRL
jgi:hypothetical protein